LLGYLKKVPKILKRFEHFLLLVSRGSFQPWRLKAHAQFTTAKLTGILFSKVNGCSSMPQSKNNLPSTEKIHARNLDFHEMDHLPARNN